MAVTNNGQSVQSVQLIDVKSQKILHSQLIPKSWFGLCFSADEKFLYASGGNDNWILKYAIASNKLVLKDSIKLGKKWPEKISPAGIALDDKRNLLYVVTKENNSLYIIDLLTKTIKKQLSIGAEGFTCLLSRDKKELYISVWGGDKILVLNTNTQTFIDSIAVGDNPNDMCFPKMDNIYL